MDDTDENEIEKLMAALCVCGCICCMAPALGAMTARIVEIVWRSSGAWTCTYGTAVTMECR